MPGITIAVDFDGKHCAHSLRCHLRTVHTSHPIWMHCMLLSNTRVRDMRWSAMQRRGGTMMIDCSLVVWHGWVRRILTGINILRAQMYGTAHAILISWVCRAQEHLSLLGRAHAQHNTMHIDVRMKVRTAAVQHGATRPKRLL